MLRPGPGHVPSPHRRINRDLHPRHGKPPPASLSSPAANQSCKTGEIGAKPRGWRGTQTCGWRGTRTRGAGGGGRKPAGGGGRKPAGGGGREPAVRAAANLRMAAGPQNLRMAARKPAGGGAGISPRRLFGRGRCLLRQPPSGRGARRAQEGRCLPGHSRARDMAAGRAQPPRRSWGTRAQGPRTRRPTGPRGRRCVPLWPARPGPARRVTCHPGRPRPASQQAG